MRYFILFCFLLFFGFSGFSQYTISGKITNEKNQPLQGSHIHTKYINVASNPIGEFEMKGLPKGELRIFISYLGYATKDTLLDVSSDKYLNVILKPATTTLAEVTVKQDTDRTTKTLREEQIKKDLIDRRSAQSLADVLKEVSGVSLLKTGSTIVKPIINGLHSSRVPVFSNQVRLEDQQWGTEHAPNFDINAAGKITVIKGASGLQYGGDAVGGVVLIEPIRLAKDTLFGKTIVSAVSNGRGGAISSSVYRENTEGWRWNLLTTYKFFGDRETPNYVLSNTGNRELNFSGSASYSKKNHELSAYYSFYTAEIGILSASHIGNVTDLYNAIQNRAFLAVADFTYSLKSPMQAVQHHLFKLNYNQKIDESSSLSTYYALQFNERREFDLRRGDNANKAALNLELATHTMQSDYKKEGEKFELKTGVTGLFQNNFADPKTGVRPLIPTYMRFDAGFYGIGSYDVNENVLVESGFRYDFSTLKATKYYLKSRWDEREYDVDFTNIIVGETGNQWLTQPRFSFHNLSASLGFRYDLHGGSKWFNSISLSNRNPNPSEFFSDGLHHSSGQVELGDLRLKREQSVKLSSSLTKQWSGFSLELNPYYHRISNFMFLKPIGFETTIRGAFPVWEFQQTAARLFGVDVTTQWNINQNWLHRFSMAFVDGHDLTNKAPLIDMPPVTFSSVLQFKKPKWRNLILEVQSESVFKQTRFPNFNFTTQIVENNELVSVVVDVSTPPSGYQLFHLYSEISVTTFQKVVASLAFSVQNIANMTYRDYLNRQRFFADEMGRNVQIQLKIKY